MATHDGVQGRIARQGGEVVAAESCLDSGGAGRYANFFKVGYNALEVVIEFGESFSDDAPARVHTRIVTHPVYARAFLALLDESVLARDDPPGDPPGRDARSDP